MKKRKALVQSKLIKKDKLRELPPVSFPRMLIVEDEENLLDILCECFRLHHFDVSPATNVEDALTKIRKNPFDAMIADIGLGGIKGREGLALIPVFRQRSPSAKVIIVTANGLDETEKTARVLGADYFFEKPVDLRILLHCLEGAGRSGGTPGNILKR